MADIKSEIVLKMPFLTMNNAEVDFQARKLQWRSYTTRDILPTTRQVELIGKKEFAAAVFNSKHEAFVVYVTALNIDSGNEVHPLRKAQIAYLKADKAPSKVLNKYADFADIFSLRLAAKLPEHTKINNHAIELINDQQPPYDFIYSLGPMELEILKAYIKINLVSNFIKPSKSPAGAPILFDKKPNGSLRLYIDY